MTVSQTINCKGQLIDLTQPKVMGILNITPDSFYDGGRYKNEQEILKQADKMLTNGAHFIDIGGYSSKPGTSFVNEEEETNRVLPVVELLLKKFPDIMLSIDTFRSTVAKQAIGAGAAIINDISAGNLDPKMMETAGALQVPYIMMHMQGTPQNMQNAPSYNDVVKDLIFFFSQKISEAKKHQIHDLVIDPGFGFGKTVQHNYEILKKLELFDMLDSPVLIGVSRKSMIYKVLNITAEEALNGTSCLHTISLLKGAKILRVHDVKEATECIRLVDQLR